MFPLFPPDKGRILEAFGRASSWEAWPEGLHAGLRVQSSRTPLGAVAIARRQVKECATIRVIGESRFPIVGPVHPAEGSFRRPR
jgi:hypothetical protein